MYTSNLKRNELVVKRKYDIMFEEMKQIDIKGNKEKRYTFIPKNVHVYTKNVTKQNK